MANPTLGPFSSKLFLQLEDPVSAYGPLAQSCVSEAVYNLALSLGIEPNAQSIKIQLKELKAADVKPRFEYHLCDAVGRAMVVKQAELFKKQFETTGTITLQEMDAVCPSIDRVFSGNGKFSGIPNAKQLLLSETLREIEKISPPVEQKRSVQKFFSSFPRFYAQSPEAILAEKRLETLKQMRESMQSPMLSTTAPLWGVNDEGWEEPEPTELDPDGFDSELEPVQIPNYPELEAFELHRIKSQSIYPELPVTGPGTRLHFRVSYIDLAFPELFKKTQSDQKTWDSLPGIVQRDALRHCIHLQSCTGAAEELACRLFKSTDEFKMQLQLSGLTSSSVNTGLSKEFISEGEKLLELYYSSAHQQTPLSCLDFSTMFNALPKETLFLQYVYEMAKAAGIHIESWDHNYAENHWKKIDMINLSVQALERCLHTKRG